MIAYLLGVFSGIPLGLLGAAYYFSRSKKPGVRLDAP